MAAYCRVSTDQLEQLSSYEAQVQYYTTYICNNPDYKFAGIYADEGITGTSTKKREQFNRMINDCKAGKIDVIITKSISRFARNTLDCLNYVRVLKELGVEVIFEKENIRTLDSKGEVLISILASLAQEESFSTGTILYYIYVTILIINLPESMPMKASQGLVQKSVSSLTE